jgi:nucleotide-binding universal stress UspA family protein
MKICSLLLPLDGSDLAENALPAAAYFARFEGASVTLLHVIEKGARNRVHACRHLTQPREAAHYLKDVAARYLPPDLTVRRHVHEAAVRDVARGIAEHSRELHPDLIVLCAHGSGGARDWLIGNIAQQVIARCSTPVLLLRPSEAPAPEASFALRSILLPVDFTPEHQPSGLPAEYVSKKSGASLHLAMVVPTPGTLSGEPAAAGKLLPHSTEALLDLTEKSAGDFLAEKMERLQAEGVKTTAEVLRGDPAAVLADLVRRRADDLIILGTHGKAGSAAFWNRSVAARVLAKVKIPALLIPLQYSS